MTQLPADMLPAAMFGLFIAMPKVETSSDRRQCKSPVVAHRGPGISPPERQLMMDERSS